MKKYYTVLKFCTFVIPTGHDVISGERRDFIPKAHGNEIPRLVPRSE